MKINITLVFHLFVFKVRILHQKTAMLRLIIKQRSIKQSNVILVSQYSHWQFLNPHFFYSFTHK